MDLHNLWNWPLGATMAITAFPPFSIRSINFDKNIFLSVVST